MHVDVTMVRDAVIDGNIKTMELYIEALKKVIPRNDIQEKFIKGAINTLTEAINNLNMEVWHEY